MVASTTKRNVNAYVLLNGMKKEKHTSGFRLIVKALIPLCLVFGASSIYVMLEVVPHNTITIKV